MPTSCAEASAQLVSWGLRNYPRHLARWSPACWGELAVTSLSPSFFSSPNLAVILTSFISIISTNNCFCVLLYHTHKMMCCIFPILLVPSSLLLPFSPFPVPSLSNSNQHYCNMTATNKQTLIMHIKLLDENNITEVTVSSPFSPLPNLLSLISLCLPSSLLYLPSSPPLLPLFSAGWLLANRARQD